MSKSDISILLMGIVLAIPVSIIVTLLINRIRKWLVIQRQQQGEEK